MADFISVLLAEFSTAHYAFAAAVVAGLLGVLFVLCVTLRGSAGSKDKENGEEESSSSEEKKDSEQTNKQKQQQHPRVRGVRSSKPARKVTLPSHPLLACEFKGHTGAVLSLDVDINGKYLVSCSEGGMLIWLATPLQIAQYHQNLRAHLIHDFHTGG